MATPLAAHERGGGVKEQSVDRSNEAAAGKTITGTMVPGTRVLYLGM